MEYKRKKKREKDDFGDNGEKMVCGKKKVIRKMKKRGTNKCYEEKEKIMRGKKKGIRVLGKRKKKGFQ